MSILGILIASRRATRRGRAAAGWAVAYQVGAHLQRQGRRYVR